AVAVLDEGDDPAARGLGGGVPDGQPGRAAGEPPVGDQRARLAEPAALEEGRRVQHLLHAGAALGALVADHDDVTGLDLPAEDALDGVVLRLEHHGGAGERPQLLLDAGGLDDRAVGGDVAAQDGEAAVGGVGVLDGADAAVLAVQVERLPAGALRERGGAPDAAG